MTKLSSLQTSLYFLTATILSIGLSMTGCGGGGGEEPAGGTDTAAGTTETEPRADLCALLTATDIEEALGTAAGDPQAGDEGLGQCSWPSSQGSDPLVRLTLDKAVLKSFDDFVTDFGEEFGGENPPLDQFHPVEGVGDWAMYVADDDMLRVFRGEEVLDVSSPAAEEAQLLDLARRAMPRLPRLP